MVFRVQNGPDGDGAVGATRIHSGYSQDWRDALVERYPALLKDEDGRPIGYPEVGDGWAIVVVQAVDCIAAVARGAQEDIRIVEVKEKFGTLRIYTNALRSSTAAAAVEDIVALAEARSECTCDICGNEGVLYQSGDVLITRCAAHGAGAPVLVRAGWENVHIKRHLKGGEVSIVYCRRYDRDNDVFVVVPPSTLGIKE
jgi:hypothetical protein